MNTLDQPHIHRDAHAIRFASRLSACGAYSPPRLQGPLDLRLDANEGPSHPAVQEAIRAVSASVSAQQYPSTLTLTGAIALMHNIDTSRVLVTAGGDELIQRACRATLDERRNMVIAVPTFDIFTRCAAQEGAQVRSCDWQSEFPLQDMLAAIDPDTGMIVVVSPNNPTGQVVSFSDVQQLARAAPHALVVLDLAYVEFTSTDPTPQALALDNVLVVRTFSKALGLAGLRVGYGLAHADVITALRSVGLPYSVSAHSVAVVEALLPRRDEIASTVSTRVRCEREELISVLTDLGCVCTPSEANFVLARFADTRQAQWVWRALGSLGIAVRSFSGVPGLEACLRVTCPGNATHFARLLHALHTSIAPDALLLDMDGVLADVSQSYRRAILATADTFGVRITRADIAAMKARGDANNDWLVTQRLLQQRGVDASLAEVRDRFEGLYQGTDAEPGLRAHEVLIPRRETLERLSQRLTLSVVTGRPRRDCERFLHEHGLSDLFTGAVCMEDGPAKPDPTPVTLALQRLGCARAWMVGDTRDDIDAARTAGVVGIGVIAPPGEQGDRQALERAGAATVIDDLDVLLEMLA
jgi:histidinol-phosphate aminotransferase